MRTLAAILALLACLGGIADARAADPSVIMDDGTPVTVKLVQDLNKERKRTLKDTWVWVASEGLQPREKPRLSARSSGAKDFPFLTRVNHVLTEQTDVVHLLIAEGEIGTADFRILGWVPESLVVNSSGEARRDPSTNIFHKAMVVNSVDYVLKEKRADAAVEVLKAPDDSPKTPRNDAFRLFSVYFVFADTNPRDEKEGYLLLGSQANINPAVAATDASVVSKVILGWVDKRRVCLWKTREAVEWDANPERRTPVRVFKDLAEAKKVQNRQAEGGASLLFEEGFSESARPIPWKHDQMRYPVLPISDTELTFAGDNNTLRRIAVVGDFVDENGKVIASGADVAEMQEKLARLQQESQVTELLFVIDDSASMDPWFTNTADTIDGLIRKVKPAAGTLKIGVAYYADVTKTDRADREKLRRAVDLRTALLQDVSDSKAAAALTKSIRDHKTREGYDPREQMFLGLHMGIEAAQFSPYARKIVVHLGDKGNTSAGEPAIVLTEKDILAKLTPKGQSPIEYFSLQVEPAGDEDNAAFDTQTKTIVDLFQKETKGERPAGHFKVTDSAGLQTTVLKRFEELQRQAGELEDSIAKARRGQFNAITKISKELETMLKNEGIDIEKMRKAKGVQLFQYGYVWDKDDKKTQQVKQRLLLSQRELKDVSEFLGEFFQADSPGSTGEDVASFIANKMAGDPTKSVASLIKVKGLAFRSPLLDTVAGEMKAKPLSDAPVLLQRILKRQMLMDDILKKTKYQYVTDPKRVPPDRVGLLRQGAGDPLDRAYVLQSSAASLWYWIDFEEEWP